MAEKEKYSLITQIRAGSSGLCDAVQIIASAGGEILKISTDSRIDPMSTYFSLLCTRETFFEIYKSFLARGYLKKRCITSPAVMLSAKIADGLGIAEFLSILNKYETSILSTGYDDGKLTVGIITGDIEKTDKLIAELKESFDITADRYDLTGEALGDSIFESGFMENISRYTGVEGENLHAYVNELQRFVSERIMRGGDGVQAFERLILNGDFLTRTTGSGFYADVQKIEVNNGLTLFCFQLPGGGSIYLLDSPDSLIMIDTGYGIYADDAKKMFAHYGLDISRLKYIIATHGDADHCGAGGAYDVPVYMHPGTHKIILCGNRAWGSISEDSILEQLYTTMIGKFSRFNQSAEENIREFPEYSEERVGGFMKLAEMETGGIHLQILLSSGGHQFGQLIIYSEDGDLLFTADTLMNFSSFPESRRDYNSIADYLVTSVNVDSELARGERRGVTKLAMDHEAASGRKCLICGGHGTVSTLNAEGKLETFGNVMHYTHDSCAE